MSYYDDASLVVIPSGFKTSKVYAEKPTDGSGDLTFTRTGDTATRVNSAGIIEKVRTNLALRSNTFNTTWTNVGSSETSGQAGYDGTTNAWSLIEDSSTGLHVLLQTIATTGLVTLSVYAKAGTRNWVYLRGVQSSANVRAWFNLSTGAIGTVEANGTAKIESVGNGWYRCSLTVANFQTGFESYIGVASADNASSYTGNGTGNVLIQNFQYETGDIATAYIPTTTAAVSVGPTANTARLDYLGSTCPRLLLEPQRTNVAIFSEQFDNSNWAKSNATVTANTTVSPDGYQNADTIAFTASATAFCQRAIGGTHESQSHTVSVYARVATGTATFRLKCTHGGVLDYFSSDFTATTTWQRFTFTATFGATIGTSLVYGVINGTNALAKSVIFYGFQCELNASYATSYIPCLAATATRGADAASKTGISSLIGQTEGTVFVDFRINGLANFGTPICVNNGSNTNLIWLTIFSNGNLRAELYNGTQQTALIYGGAVAGGRYKMAFGYKTNDFVLYVNGTQVGTDNSGTTFSGTTLSRVDTDLTNASVYSTASESINQALLFKTRLTNAELAELTTL